MAMTLKQLRETPTDDLIRLHDEITPHTFVGIDYYLQEIARRDAARQTRQLLRLTWLVAACTVVVTAGTVVSAVFVVLE
jgi:hypothetical protein